MRFFVVADAQRECVSRLHYYVQVSHSWLVACVLYHRMEPARVMLSDCTRYSIFWMGLATGTYGKCLGPNWGNANARPTEHLQQDKSNKQDSTLFNDWDRPPG